MNRWYFTVAFELDELPEFMTVEDFFEEDRPKVKFPLKDYRILDADFISATAEVKTVELFLNFETAYPFKMVTQDFNDQQLYYFNIIFQKQIFKVRGRVVDMFFPDEFDPLYGYKILTSKNKRLNRD